MATAGNVDAGKSTLLGVLTHNIRDDGRGFARSKMFRHQHELESGRTSSIGESTVAVDSRGKIIMKYKYASNKDDIDAYTSRAHKMFDFLDLAGHEKYLKTTIYGLVGLKPDYIMLVIGSNMGLIGMAREHLGLSLALEIPIFFVLTKIDICPEDGTGCVVSGMLTSGTIKKNPESQFLIGPDESGKFIRVSIKSIHRKRSPVDIIKRTEVRKGMVIVSTQPTPTAYWQFKAVIHILHHPTTIGPKYQAVVNVGPIRQSASILWMEKDVLRTGDRAFVIMAFHKHPEYLVKESTLVFREGRTKAIGTIKELLMPAN
ncbi:hypothetical protein MXB_2888, partial [Myxobolus squamalis]